ncbi:MAG: hypothetical protein HYW52_11950 [Gemmatimonadetes bacterium]|nr:hypothetical protein [Gemmatimonadota bacterium]MBI2616365.1 hypothetical protein [Gemmatimonadota bacterium]
MNRKLGFIMLAATLAVATAAALYHGPAAAGVSAAATGQDTSRAQLRRLMAEKVHRAEIILRGLAQGDLNTVQKAADELVQIAAQANWSVAPRAREAAVNEAEFQRRAALLAKFARDGDLHASYYQFVQVVFQCFDCHEELRPPRR